MTHLVRPKNIMKLKSILMTLSIAILYSLLLWLALVYFPILKSPEWFTALFSSKAQALIPWIKLRHTALVCIVAIPVAFASLKILDNHALVGGLVAGGLVAIYSEINNCIFSIRFEVVPNISEYLKYRLRDPIIPVWVPLTDFIVLTGALPLAVWAIDKIRLRHNNGIET